MDGIVGTSNTVENLFRFFQVTLLDDQLTSIRDELKEQRRLLEDRTQNVRRLERDLQQREDRIEELTKVGILRGKNL